MRRIFLGLAAVAILLMLANALLGLVTGDFNAAYHDAAVAIREAEALEKDRLATPAALAEAKQRIAAAKIPFKQREAVMTWHILLGSAAALVTLLVNSISVTYFIGTARWSKEVVDAYHLAPQLSEESARIKRRSFPYSLLGIATILAVVVLGAAADPRGMNRNHAADWVQVHYLFAFASLLAIAWAFAMQGQCLAEHFALIEKIMAEVRRIRSERSLAQETVS